MGPYDVVHVRDNPITSGSGSVPHSLFTGDGGPTDATKTQVETELAYLVCSAGTGPWDIGGSSSVERTFTSCGGPKVG